MTFGISICCFGVRSLNKEFRQTEGDEHQNYLRMQMLRCKINFHWDQIDKMKPEEEKEESSEEEEEKISSDESDDE